MSRVHPRNNAVFDKWSIVHLVTGILLGLLLHPLLAIIIMVLWEPLEVFVLSPFLAKRGIEFGYETWRNSLSDIVFDTVGVAIGYVILQI
ncbi:hypothetical protein BH09PAT4_BH09PAT4_00920 [soil metagenome]